jgi:hypothetical protein
MTSWSSKRQNMTSVELLPGLLNRYELGTFTKAHLFRDAPTHCLLLGGCHRDAFPPLGAAAENLTASTGLLAGTETVRALAALVMRLVRTLHGYSPGFAERDRYAIERGVSRRREARRYDHGKSCGPPATITRAISTPDLDDEYLIFGSRNCVDFVLRSEIAICYVRQTFCCG